MFVTDNAEAIAVAAFDFGPVSVPAGAIGALLILGPIRLFTIAAATLWFAAPAVADCQEELNNLKQPL